MKKNKYIVPAMRVREIEDEELMAALSGTNTDSGLNNPPSVVPGENNGQGGAKRSLFDNDYDDGKSERASRWY